ncbi:Acylphosphatase [Wolfiporia cocos MD-104 SS10]|uniref:acylphosphatase n=1 Tax=Wolfiporia cocos (strain MD-104) TaxID=742152 RepID=A0A2H3J1Z9_WOLCO|nr:Acylphosphatase [Wolfiporia cocos MD-104 SS10]
MSYRAFNFLVSGKVQGVYFRAFSKGIAHDIGVVGWIRNNNRGNVEGEAQGSEEVLIRFKKALQTGPPHARVTSVEITNERVLDSLEYDIFETLAHSNMAGKPRMSIGDILHRGVVYTLFGISVWGIVMMGLIHRDTIKRGNEDEANEIALAEAAQAALQRKGKTW